MRVAVVSDTHDHWPNIDRACAHFRGENIQALVHCGDVCAPLTLLHLSEVFSGQIHCVLGNVDGDSFLMVTRTLGLKKIHHHGAELGRLEIGDRTIALQHYPTLARGLALTGQYDAVFYGHDHTRHQEYLTVKDKQVLLANPGTLSAMGRRAGFGIYDSRHNAMQFLRLEELGPEIAAEP